MKEARMRILVAFALIILAPVAWAQSPGNTKSIPDDFIAKMANDLAGLTADPLPNEPGTARISTMLGHTVPSKVQVIKTGQVWSTDATGKVMTRQITAGSQASVYGATDNYYQVEGLGDNNKWWVAATDVAPAGPPRRVDAVDPGWLGQQIEKLMKNASAFRDNYKSNPYVNVHGFSINVGVPPSINMEFEFK